MRKKRRVKEENDLMAIETTHENTQTDNKCFQHHHNEWTNECEPMNRNAGLVPGSVTSMSMSMCVCLSQT